MSCINCSSIVGYSYQIFEASWLGSLGCNADILEQFPKVDSIYRGKNEANQHVYELNPKVICPHCGFRGDNLVIDCREPKDGIELPLLIELPERVEK